MSSTTMRTRPSKPRSPSEAAASEAAERAREPSHVDPPTYTRRLARVVLPVSAAFTTLYASSFTYSMATGEYDPASRDPGDVVAAGEVKPGWRYEVSTRGIPKTYRLDVGQVRAAGGVCAVEVRGYPKPLRALPGQASKLRVLFDGPLEGTAASMLEVDLMKGTRLACAVRVHNGIVLDDGLRPRRSEPEAEPPIAELRLPGPPA